MIKYEKYREYYENHIDIDPFFLHHMEEINELKEKVKWFSTTDYTSEEEMIVAAKELMEECDYYGIDTLNIYEELESEGIKI